MQLSAPAGGTWFPASDPTARYIGSMESQQGRPVLTLFGKEGGGGLPTFWLDPERTWLGEVAGWNGTVDRVTLLDCKRVSGPQPLALVARLGVAGHTHLDPDAHVLTDVEMRVPGFLDWVRLRSRLRGPQRRTEQPLGAARTEEYLGPQEWIALLPGGAVVKASSQLPNGEPWLAPAPNYPAVVDFDSPEDVRLTFRPPNAFPLSGSLSLSDPFSWLTSLALGRSIRADVLSVGAATDRWMFVRSRTNRFLGNEILSFEEPLRPPFRCDDEGEFARLLGAWFEIVASSSLALETLFDGALAAGSTPRRRILDAAGAIERLDQTVFGGTSATLGGKISSALRRFPNAEWPQRPGDFKGATVTGKGVDSLGSLLARKRNDLAHVNIPPKANALDDQVAAATLIHLSKLILVERLGVSASRAAEELKAHYEWELVL